MKETLQHKQILSLFLIVLFCGCYQLIQIENDPLNDWHEKTELLMTQSELKVYKSLKGEELKKEFIEEFWRIRDPIPETEENENKIAIRNRILYANEWFDRYRRRRRDYEAVSARGWQTAKGRIYVILGPPDKVSYGQGAGPIKKFTPPDAIYETWIYMSDDMRVIFEREKIVSTLETVAAPRDQEADPEDDARPAVVSKVVGSGGWKMMPNFKIIDAIEKAKLNMISSQYRNDAERGMRFKAKYIGDRIRINIPSDKVVYIDKDETLKVYLQIDILVYRDNEMLTDVRENKVLSFSQEEVLKLEEIIIEMPYSPNDKGEYGFDITVTDLKSEVLSKFRQFIKHVF